MSCSSSLGAAVAVERCQADFRSLCRVLLSIMYLMVETIRVRSEDDRPEWKAARDAFRNELGGCGRPQLDVVQTGS